MTCGQQIGPLQCPECSTLFSCSYWYGNSAKRALLDVDAVESKVQAMTADNLTLEGNDRLKIILKHSLSSCSQQYIWTKTLKYYQSCPVLEKSLYVPRFQEWRALHTTCSLN